MARANKLEEVILTTFEGDRDIKVERKAAVLGVDMAVQTPGWIKIIDETNDKSFITVNESIAHKQPKNIKKEDSESDVTEK